MTRSATPDADSPPLQGQAFEAWSLWWRLQQWRGPPLADKLALLKHFGSIETLFAASPAVLAGLAGEARASALFLPDPRCQQQLVRMQDWLARDPRHHLITLDDARYPAGLLDLADPPLLLFASGDTACLARPGLAVVGSRSATPQGIEHARGFSGAAAGAGLLIVSGLALGIDAAAHEGALQAGAPTVAVIGTGIDRVYPAAHRALAETIRAQGLILSELPLGAAALAHHFPRRNRLIAALSRGVLVVEAARQSGSLITARLASEIGREVFAIPGSIHSPVSKGCHELIRQGARLVECAQDISDELAPVLGKAAQGLPAAVSPAGEAQNGSHDTLPGSGGALQPDTLASSASAGMSGAPPADPVLLALGYEPSSLAQILQRCDLPVPRVRQRLLELELDRRVFRLEDGRLLRIEEAS